MHFEHEITSDNVLVTKAFDKTGMIDERAMLLPEIGGVLAEYMAENERKLSANRVNL